PAAGEVLHERAGLVLGEDAQLEDARVDEVREHEVDDTVAAAVRDRRLGAVAGERVEAAPLAPGEDHGDDRGSHGWTAASLAWPAATAKGPSVDGAPGVH